ncbi:MAG: AsmA family protein, partial [Hyphomicrobiaceae bacterium]|nr:AsmA family protein [Hyphomicrobiaceae bacterium]
PMPPVRRGPPPPNMQQAPRRGRASKKVARKRSGLLSFMLYAFVFASVIVGAGIGYLILNPPSDLIRQTIAQQVKEKTGRDLIVAGPAAFSFYPGLGVRLHDVTLSGPPGSPATLVSMKELDVNIKTMPLINRQVEVRRLILRQPVFDLRIDKQGVKNWTFAQSEGFTRYAQADTTGSDATATDVPNVATRKPGIRLPTKLSEVEHLELDDVRVEDGTLRYTDERTGQSQAITAVNMKLNLKSLSSALSAAGDFSWHGQKTDFNGRVSPVRMVLEEKPARLVFTAVNQHINASYDGALQVGDGADLEGRMNLSSTSVKGLANWLGTSVPNVAGLGPLSIAGNLKTYGNVTSLTGANITLDGATAKGNAKVTTGGARPYVQANLQISELDLNKYLGSEAGQPAAGQSSGGGARQSAPATKAGKDAIEQLLNNNPANGPRVQGYTSRAGWSSEPIDLSLLGVADADAKLRVGRLLFQNIKVGQSALTLALKSNVLKTTFDNVQLYEGQGKGFVNVDATGKAPGIGANFTLDGLSAQPFLRDAADMNWLAGKARLALQLATRGTNQLQMVEALNGNAEFTFNDGAIVGFNLPGAIRGLSQGDLSALNQAPSEKTDFSELAATFTITNGVAQNQDLRMTSPLLRVTGAGTIPMPQRTVDYMVKPKLVASLEGQKGKSDLSGLEVPVHISGSWDKPKIEPDLKGILSNPDKVVDTVKQIGKKFKGKNANEIANELLGKNGSTGSVKAKDLLNNLFKQ